MHKLTRKPGVEDAGHGIEYKVERQYLIRRLLSFALLVHSSFFHIRISGHSSHSPLLRVCSGQLATMIDSYKIGLLLGSLTLCLGQQVPTFNFLSRPDLLAPIPDVMIYDTNLTSPGYLFLTLNSPGTTNASVGPYLYNNAGNVVWCGTDQVAAGFKAYDFEICPYQGAQHICFTQFKGAVGGGPGGLGSFTRIIDNTYTTVQEVSPSGKYKGRNLTTDLHEFNMKGTDGNSTLILSYITFPLNVSYPGCTMPDTQFTKTGIFSEVSTDGKDTEIFKWAAIDHVDPRDTYICPGDTNAGSGLHQGDGLDFFHMNSADKDENGDYLISGRHVSTLYKVAGLSNPDGHAPGSIIWRLGGKNNTFTNLVSEVDGAPNLNFSWQHHARFAPSIGGVTIWDNANNNVNPPSALASSGKSISLSPATETATLVGQYVPPSWLLDSSQGSHQILPDGNHFLGLGSEPFLAEETADGTAVYYAGLGLQSYRAFKYDWTGMPPTSEMGLFAYSKTCNGTAAFYASWNGATEVESWEFFTGGDNATTASGFKSVNASATDGSFETFGTGAFDIYAYAIAYDAQNKELGRTQTVKNFVPGAQLAGSCGDVACPAGTNYTTAEQSDCAVTRMEF